MLATRLLGTALRLLLGGLALLGLLLGLLLRLLLGLLLLRLLLTLLRLLLTLLRLLLLPAALGGLQLPGLLERLHQVVELGHDAHAAFLIAALGERARAIHDLLDVAQPILLELGLGKPLLDLVELLRAILLLLGEGGPAQEERNTRAREKQSAHPAHPHFLLPQR